MYTPLASKRFPRSSLERTLGGGTLSRLALGRRGKEFTSTTPGVYVSAQDKGGGVNLGRGSGAPAGGSTE